MGVSILPIRTNLFLTFWEHALHYYEFSKATIGTKHAFSKNKKNVMKLKICKNANDLKSDTFSIKLKYTVLRSQYYVSPFLKNY